MFVAASLRQGRQTAASHRVDHGWRTLSGQLPPPRTFAHADGMKNAGFRAAQANLAATHYYRSVFTR
jgi:hypothetical protein